MLRSNHDKHTSVHHHHMPTTLRIALWVVLFVMALIALPTTLSFVQAATQPVILSVSQPETSAAAALLNDESAAVRDEGIQKLASIGTVEATDQLIAFFQRDEYLTDNGLATARALSATGSREAHQTLINALRSNESPARRMAAMAGLEEAKPIVTPLLVSALQSNDAAMRLGAVEVLGFRRASESIPALQAATRDSDPAVRTAAVWALHSTAGVQALPRFAQLQLTDGDASVRAAANTAVENTYEGMAALAEVDRASLRAIAAASNTGRAYAVTTQNLYTLHDGTWRLVAAALPDVATALAVANDGQTLYLGTTSLGLYRSGDGGLSWQHLELSVPNVRDLSVSAVTVHPADDRIVYAALTTLLGTSSVHEAPLGVFRSVDGGNSWRALQNARSNQVTTQLVVDQTAPEFLYGVTADGAWRTRVQ